MGSIAAITGAGIVVATARGVGAFEESLRAGATRFGRLERPGRTGPRVFFGSEIKDTSFENVKPGLLRTASLSSQVAVEAVSQAWADAGLDARGISRDRIGVVVGGTNFQQRHNQQMVERSARMPELIRPTYGLSFWDSDMIGVLSEYFGIRGDSFCVGGASAGGAMAIVHAARQLEWGLVDVSIAVGPLFDISYAECQAMANLGAMGGAGFPDEPDLACRPFDRRHDGFIFGEGCAAVVLERGGAGVWGQLMGWGNAQDGMRSATPDTMGQQKAIVAALRMAGLEPDQIDYVNPHGTGSPLGDETELQSLQACGLGHCWINATKSLTGHCLTAAGTIEALATLIQMRSGFLHPTRNLEDPVDGSWRWVRGESVRQELRYAVSNSFAFGGVSVSLVLGRAAD